MGNPIVKLKEYYLVWSTIVDAPITYGLTLDELKDFIRDRYGSEGMNELPSRLERVEQKGTSAHDDDDAIDTIWLNRAGPNESALTIEGMYRHYCLREPIQEAWIVPESMRYRDDDSGEFYAFVVGDWGKEQVRQ